MRAGENGNTESVYRYMCIDMTVLILYVGVRPRLTCISSSMNALSAAVRQ